MDGGDRGLQLEGADRPRGQGSLDEPDALADPDLVPERPILLGQRHEGAVAADARRPSGVAEQHQRQQAGHLAGVGQMAVQLAGQPDGLVRQGHVVQPGPGRAGVALGEDQVEDLSRRRDPVGQLFGRRHGEAGVDLPEPGLGAADALRHRRLRHQERPGDLAGAQPADRPQRQGNLRGPRQRRVTAEQQQRQRVVVLAGVREVSCRCQKLAFRRTSGDELLPVGSSPLAAPMVHQAAPRNSGQPARRVLRQPLVGPLLRCGKQRLLHCVLGGVEVAVAPHECGEHVRRTAAPDVLQAGHWSSLPIDMIGRSSTVPPGWAK